MRREKALQPSDPPQLLDLFGDPCFKTAVQFAHLLGALAQFVQQPRIFHCNDRLRGEVFQQSNLFVGEGLNFRASSGNVAEQPVVLAQRDQQKGAGICELQSAAPYRIVQLRGGGMRILNVDVALSIDQSLMEGVAAEWLTNHRHEFFAVAARRDRAEMFAVKQNEGAFSRAA